MATLEKIQITMKSQLLLLLSVLFTSAMAQDQRENEIRRLENLEREALIKGDSTALFNKLWSSNIVFNTPANVVGTVEGTKRIFQTGGLGYQSFERKIDKITFFDNVAIVMGGEFIKPQGTQPNAGKTVSRRFTNVWQNHDGTWTMIARHSTTIKIE
jgi:hypothetical protein